MSPSQTTAGDPLAYLITFTCYGTWLHGDEAGSVDRDHNVFSTAWITANPPRKLIARRRMSQQPYQLDVARRSLVLKALKKVCVQRGWRLLAAHVRSNHVHIVVAADRAPEPVMNDFKAYASRALNAAKVDPPKRKRWTRHGSTKYLWNEDALASAIHYTVHEQGAPMEVHLDPDYQASQSRERQRALGDERGWTSFPQARASAAKHSESENAGTNPPEQSRERQRAPGDDADTTALPHGRGSQEESDLAHLTTEARNPASEAIDGLSALEIVRLMNREDARVPQAIAAQAQNIAKAIETIAEQFRRGGRLIYVGAGTSGRLGVLDAAECPPTFRTPPEMVVGLIAGGPPALVRAVEGLEDHPEVGAADLAAMDVSQRDVVVSIATSGRTPYCIGAADEARRRGAFTIGLVCNQPSQLDEHVDLIIAPIVGPEVISGSTRLKAGTATKLVLNMLTTGAMVRIGKTYGNLMVDLKSTNTKLWARARRIIAGLTDLSLDDAADLLTRCGGEVKTALVAGCANISPEQARARLASNNGHVREALAPSAAGTAPPAETPPTASGQTLLLGVDGGGSRTVALLSDAAGNILGRGTAGPSNPQAVGFMTAQDAIMAAVDAAFGDAKLPRQPVQAVCLGLAGAGRPDDQRRLHEWAKNQRLAERIEIVPDALLLLAAAKPPITTLPHKRGRTTRARRTSAPLACDGEGSNAWGIAVVAGTGSMVFGRAPDGQTARAGGWGPTLGDEGSAYWIAMRALQCVVRSADGRVAPTVLGERLLAALSLDDAQQLVGYVARGAADRHRIAELAPVVDQAAEDGDPQARAILAAGAHELAEQVRAVATQLHMPNDPLPLVLSGSALLGSRSLREGMIARLQEAGAQPALQTVTQPALGALRLAADVSRTCQ